MILPLILQLNKLQSEVDKARRDRERERDRALWSKEADHEYPRQRQQTSSTEIDHEGYWSMWDGGASSADYGLAVSESGPSREFPPIQNGSTSFKI